MTSCSGAQSSISHATRRLAVLQGVELVHNMSAGVVMNGLNLVLRNLQREQSGSYTCTAANNEGRVTSNAVLLSVRRECLGEVVVEGERDNEGWG